MQKKPADCFAKSACHESGGKGPLNKAPLHFNWKALPDMHFKPAETSDLRVLSFKMALLIVLVNACMQFDPDNCMVRLMPRHGYMPKVLSTAFRAQVITLQSFHPPDPASGEACRRSSLCPVHALCAYVDITSDFHMSEQLLVCFVGVEKAQSVSKHRFSHWIMEAI